MSEEKKNLEEKEAKKTNLKDKMLSGDDLTQVSGGIAGSTVPWKVDQAIRHIETGN